MEYSVIVLFNSLNSKSLEVRNASKKVRKSEQNQKKLDEDAMLCNTLWSDRRRLIKKTSFAFRVLLNVRIDPSVPQKGFFCFIQKEISLSGRKKLA